ncbi:hypothetical protein Tco_0009888 [Tanacetum coccineum]
MDTHPPTPIRSPKVTDPTPSSSPPKPKTGRFRWYKSFIQQMGGHYGHLFGHLKKTFMPKKSFHKLAKTLLKTLREFLPLMFNTKVNKIAKTNVLIYVTEGLLLDKQKTQADVAIQKERKNLQAEISLQVTNALANSILAQSKFDKPTPSAAPCRTDFVCTRDHEDHHDNDAHLEGESSAKRQKTSEYGTYSVGESSSEQAIDQEPNPSSSGMESYQQKVNLTTPTITFLGIERKKLFTITSKPVIGMIYENRKKEKRVMIHKFCDATLKRVLEMLKKYNKYVKYGYANPSPSDADAKYLQFYKEDIEELLKHRDQMRRWEIYVNGRPLGSRRGLPE